MAIFIHFFGMKSDETFDISISRFGDDIHEQSLGLILILKIAALHRLSGGSVNCLRTETKSSTVNRNR